MGSVFIDTMLRVEKNPDVKYMVLLGEEGGAEEYIIIEALMNGLISQPLIARCIGVIAKHFSPRVQFGHAGASANAEAETPPPKNKDMAEAGSICAPILSH